MLLNIFRHYLHASPHLWPRLVHICRKWRHIVFTSQQALHLRLFCSFGTPISKTLDCWPPLPIVLEYGSSLALDPPSPEDEVNIITALKRSDRVNSISLTVTATLLDKLYRDAVERPFLELEDLILLSQDSLPLALPKTFLCAPRLRRLHLTGIRMPGLLQLLHSSRDLEDLQLHEALGSCCFSIDKFTDALSELAQLQSISLRFSSATDPFLSRSPPDRRVVFPALTSLKFLGCAKYLERLVLRMDAPRLADIQFTFSDTFIYYLPNLSKFVDGIEMQKSHHQARILSSERAISISLTQHGASTCFTLRLLTERLNEPIFFMTCILSFFPAFLLNVDDLCISVTQASESTQEVSSYGERWQKLLKPFTGVKWLHLDVNNSTSSEILHALQGISWMPQTTVLPVLYKLYLPHLGPRHVPLSEAVVSFMTSRWRSGNPIGVEYVRLHRVSEPHGRGTSPCTVPLHYVLILLKQDLFLRQSPLAMRYSPMTSFSTSFDNIWTPLRDFGLFSHTCAEGGNRSY